MLADRYVLGALLGTGGMAEVFEAVAHGAHGFVRRVAIKRILPAQASDPSVVRLFLDEARIASKLHHAGIVAVLDYAVTDDVPFQVLELVDGWNVGQLGREAMRRQQMLPLEVALYLATEAAHALAYAHEATDERGSPLGIVHRDVKPSNLLVSRDGAVKLGDFGIALARERASKTTGFVVRGTPAYMAPEQLMGATVDARADVFALGCTLHTFITGVSPLTDDSARAAIAHGVKLPVSPRLPPAILAIIERAVSIVPDARFRTARELAQALGAELSPLLRTDPKSCMMQWLHSLAAPPPVTTTISNTVLTVAPHTATRLTATLMATDRVFSSSTAAFAPTQPGGPTSQGGPSYGATPHPWSGAPPPAHGTSLVPRPAGQVPPTLDGTGVQVAALGLSAPQNALPPHSGAVAPSPPRPSRALVFGIAVTVPLLVALVAGVGLLVVHQLAPPAATAGPKPSAGAGDGGSPPVAAGAAVTGNATGSSSPSVARPRELKAPFSVDASAPPAAAAAAIAGNAPPVSGGCICNASNGPRLGFSGVCHPQLVRAPQCSCHLDHHEMCFVAYPRQPGSDGSKVCPERFRTMPAGTRGGDPCTGFPQIGETTRNAAGQFEDFISTRAATKGELDCTRCSGSGGAYPFTPGAPCTGVRRSDGARVEGVIICK